MAHPKSRGQNSIPHLKVLSVSLPAAAGGGGAWPSQKLPSCFAQWYHQEPLCGLGKTIWIQGQSQYHQDSQVLSHHLSGDKQWGLGSSWEEEVALR